MSFNTVLEKINGTVSYINQHEYLTMAIIFGLIIFAAYITPRLPNKVIGLFDNPIVKLLMFVAVAYIAKINPNVAIVLVVCLMVILHTINQRKVENMIGNLMDSVRKEDPEIVNLQNIGFDNIKKMQSLENVQGTGSIVIDKNAVRDIEHESKDMSQCNKKMNFRNEFYPSYVEANLDSYDAKYATEASMGSDSTCITNDAFPQTNIGGTNGYKESNVVGINAADTTCGYASI
jgi:hypothetical protein